ncbi:MAG: cation:proton antiporter regulatory subunit [Acidimicrobiia bacterium]|nr:cation:proton antiporter regulatory subunit [Acidimicrobiia bacterium]
MAEVQETPLPGVGVRYDFVTGDGVRVGVIVHRTGRRELLVYDRDDPDACRDVIRLDPDETHTLTDLMGASQVSETVASMLQIEGLVLDWLPVTEGSAWASRSLRESAVHTRTGVSIVAIVRGDTTIPAPGAEERLEPGDVAVAAGSTEGLRRLLDLLKA